MVHLGLPRNLFRVGSCLFNRCCLGLVYGFFWGWLRVYLGLVQGLFGIDLKLILVSFTTY